MCCIIKVSQKVLEKNYFACSKIILYGIFLIGCIVKSLLFQPHPHTKKSRKVLEGEKKISCKCILQENIHGEINGLEKNHAYNK